MKQESPTWGVQVRLYKDHVTVTNFLDNQGIPPLNDGPRRSIGLTRKAVSKIRRGVAYLEAQGQTWFVTLTYPNALPDGEVTEPGALVNVVDDKRAKRDLSAWLRRVKRLYGDFQYVWVAEVQPKRLIERNERAIHFHLVTNQRLPLQWLNESWSQVVGRGPAYPNQQRVKRSAGAYLAKYLTKGRKIEDMSPLDVLLSEIHGNRYGMDQRVNAQLKLVSWSRFPGGDWFDISKHLIPSDVPYNLTSDANYLGIWFGFSYLKGNGSTRNNTFSNRNNAEFGGLVYLREGQVDCTVNQGAGLPGREGSWTNEVP